MEHKSNTIYHYTDFDALKGIVETKELWLNNIFNSNDSKELKIFYEYLLPKLTKQLNPNDCKVLPKNIDFIKSFEAFLKQIDFSPFYIACFSFLNDDAAQWERYGYAASGVRIAFDKELLKSILPSNFFSGKVKYEIKNKDIKPIVEILYEYIEDNKRGTFNSALFKLRNLAAIFKHKSFQAEKEFRICVDQKKVEDKVNSVLLKETIVANSLKEICILHLDKLCEHNGVEFEKLIKNVVLGPKAAISVGAIKRYLIAKGLKRLANNVSSSECPLQ